ncbi:MAG: hypothetical protein EBX61_10170, partial [Betaproteobacteria bacterium]|nr:hypothetical protein [Betaproteobacteria bacterium]
MVHLHEGQSQRQKSNSTTKIKVNNKTKIKNKIEIKNKQALDTASSTGKLHNPKDLRRLRRTPRLQRAGERSDQYQGE